MTGVLNRFKTGYPPSAIQLEVLQQKRVVLIGNVSDRVGSELSHYGIEVEQFSRLEGRTLLQTVDALWHKERSVELFEDFSHLKTAAELLDKAALASHTDFRTWVRKVTAAGYPISGDTQSVPEDAAKIEYARLRKLDTEVRNHPGFPVNAAELLW
jgi:hypothetical protein